MKTLNRCNIIYFCSMPGTQCDFRSGDGDKCTHYDSGECSCAEARAEAERAKRERNGK